MDLGPATGEDAVGKGASKLVICPNGISTVFVEEAVSFANTEVILVLWKVGKLLRKVERGWTCGARWIKGSRCWQGALECDCRFRLGWTGSGVSTDGDVDRF